MSTEHSKSTSQEQHRPEAENQIEQSQKQLESLLSDAEAAFTGISEQIKSVGETHLQRHDEIIARDELRTLSLTRLRSTLLSYIDEGVMDKAAYDRIQELEDRARTGQRLIATQTEYLYSPQSASDTASGLTHNRGMIEQKAREYVDEESQNHENIPEAFFTGIKSISEAVYLFDDLETSLSKMHSGDRHLQDAFSELRRRIEHLPLSYDEDMMRSLLRSIDETLSYADDADRARNNVHTIAGDLRKLADKLADSAHDISPQKD